MPIVNKALIIESPAKTGDTSRPIYRRNDPQFLNGDQVGGVLFHTDFSFVTSYPAQANPIANGTVIKNLAADKVGSPAGDGSMVVASGQTVPFVGGGIDFSSLTALGSYLLLPAAVSLSIYNSANRYFRISQAVKLPSEANWNTGTTVIPLYTHSNVTGGDTSAAGLVTIGMRTNGGVKQLVVMRQTAFSAGVGTVEAFTNLAIPNGSPAFGSVCYWAYRRTAAGQLLTLYYMNGATPASLSVSVATGIENTGDFSATTPFVGVNSNRWTTALLTAGAATGLRIYRTSVENLVVTGRDPDAVSIADWARIRARAAYT